VCVRVQPQLLLTLARRRQGWQRERPLPGTAHPHLAVGVQGAEEAVHLVAAAQLHAHGAAQACGVVVQCVCVCVVVQCACVCLCGVHVHVCVCVC